MARRGRYSPEFRERAVRLVQEHLKDHPSQWATMRSVAEKLGCTIEALRRWVRHANGRTSEFASVGNEARNSVAFRQPLRLLLVR